MPTIAAFNLKEKSSGALYSKCICGCQANTDKPIILNSAEEAKDLIAYLKLDGWVPAVYVDDSWKSREREKFNNGTYQVPLWYGEKWYLENQAHFDRYYPHVAKGNPDKISITDTPEKGMQDVQTAILPGKYLKRFFGKVLSADEIKEWANRHIEEWGKPLELQIATTAEEIADVYQQEAGFTSCMQKPIGLFSSLLNPTYVYGESNGMVLGYIQDRRGKLLARALIQPEKQKVGRVYGDQHRLRAAVKAKFGFETEADNHNFDLMEHSNILRIDYEDGGAIMPYIDGEIAIVNRTDHYELQRGRSNARNVTGWIGSVCQCQRCGNQIKQGRVYRVYRDTSNRAENWTRWCVACVNDYSVYDEEDGRSFIYDDSYVANFSAVLGYSEDEGEVIKRYRSSRQDDFVRDPDTHFYIPKDRAVIVNKGAKVIIKDRIQILSKRGEVFKSAFDNELYYGHKPILVDGEIWTAKQAKEFAVFDPETFTFHKGTPEKVDPISDEADVEVEELLADL